MELQVIITSEELNAIRAYADFVRDNEAPCDRKCGPPGSPDRRACCGCPDQAEWARRINEFAKAHGLTDDILKNESVKRYIAAYNECVFASLALKAAKERDIKAGLAYQDARDAFTMKEVKDVACGDLDCANCVNGKCRINYHRQPDEQCCKEWVRT